MLAQTDTTARSTSSASVGQEDLTLLANLTEKDINDNLKLRFSRNLIYTNIGNVLLSVNPYKPIPFLYDTELIEFYKLGGKERSISNVLGLQRKMREKILLMLESEGSAKHKGGSLASGGGGAGISAMHQRFNTRSSTAHIMNNNQGSHAAPLVVQLQQNKSLMASLTSTSGGGGGGVRGNPLALAFPHLAGGPHVFQLANSMFHALLTEEENQTVIISGESGAGKTEASKQIINFISFLSDKQRGEQRQRARQSARENTGAASGAGGKESAEQQGEGEGDTIDKIKGIILESNPLMEAFGNAKTVKNDNSSRFGKFFEIYFPKSREATLYGADGDAPDAAGGSLHDFYGLPVGGHMSIFLLEKSRVVQQQFGERNFHIFYQLLAGLDKETRSRLRLDGAGWQRQGGGRRVGRGGDGAAAFRYLSSGRTTTIDRIDDSAEFAKTRNAMRVVGISETVQTFIFEVLAIILHLGELVFVDSNGWDGEEAGDEGGGRCAAAAVTGSSTCRIENQDTLQFITSLLQLEDAAALEKALTVKTLEIGEKGEVGGGAGVRKNIQVVEVPLDAAECRSNRDAVAKLLYDAVFNFIVYFINNALSTASAFTSPASKTGEGGANGGTEDVLFQNYAENMRQENIEEAQEISAERFLMLGVLDIYGFEIFANNSFEQFCINYINEKLHQIFIDLTLKKEQEEYESEGIVLPQKIDSFFDNKRILNVIEGTAGGHGAQKDDGTAVAIPGIFQLLDDICVSLAREPEHIADAKFLEKLDMFLSTSPAAAPFFQKSEKNGFFTVKHYAGNVTYNVNGFVTKNKDKLSNAILEELRKSGNIFVGEILAPTMALLDEEAEKSLRNRQLGTGRGGGGAKRKNIFMSSGKKIRQQADVLVAKLRSSSIHYIRTIKPNEEKKSDLFVDECVLHQIQYLGLMENVKIRKMGFIYRNYFDVFLRRFYIIFSLMNERMKRQQYSPYGGGGGGSGGKGGGGRGAYGYVEPYNFLEHDDKESCAVLLAFVENEVARVQQPHQPLHSHPPSASSAAMLRATGFEKGCWQLGSTKVFIRQPGHLATLERLREACVDAKVRKIQRCYRTFKSEKANILLKQKMTRLYRKRDKARRTDSVFRSYTGDYLDVKGSSTYFAHNAERNHRDLLRILRYDPLAVGWRELFSERDGKFYYVNLFTGESQWMKPAAMAEMELYNDSGATAADEDGDEEGRGGGGGRRGQGDGDIAVSSLEPINVEGVRVLFSAKVDRVRVAVPQPFGLTPQPAQSRLPERAGESETATPHCVREPTLFIVTNKAVFLFQEVVTPVDASNAAAAADRVGVPSGVSAAPTAGERDGDREGARRTALTSRLALVKRIDLRLLRGITVSPFADTFVFLHVYPQLEPCRPVFRSRPAHTATTTATAAAAQAEGGKGGKEGPPKAARRRGNGTAQSAPSPPPPPEPISLCDCCGRPLTPSTPHAHCPCCGRLCCVTTCLSDSASSAAGGGAAGPRRRRPLPNLLGSNVVNPDALAEVVAEKEAALAAVAARRAQRERPAKPSAGRKGKKSGGVAPPPLLEEGGDAGDDGDRVAYHVFTAEEDTKRVEEVVVCPWCVNLEPREINEDVVIQSFLRTELAAYLLQEYRRIMGCPLPFHVMDANATITLSLAVNKELERRVLSAAAASLADGEGSWDERKVLAALVAGRAAGDAERKSGKHARGKHGKKEKGPAAAPPSPLQAPPVPDVVLPFSSYQSVTVQCEARADGTTDEDSHVMVHWADTPSSWPQLQLLLQERLSHGGEADGQGPSRIFGPLRLHTSAPPGLSKSVIAAIDATREERRRASERRRRDEAAALRAKAEAKAQEREEAYARMVEEKKRERRERAAAERNARLWKEEEQRQKREAAARLVAEKARRGL